MPIATRTALMVIIVVCAANAETLRELMSPESDFKDDVDFLEENIKKTGYNFIKRFGSGVIGEVFLVVFSAEPKNPQALKIAKEIRYFDPENAFPICNNYKTQMELAEEMPGIFMPTKIFPFEQSFDETVTWENTYATASA